MRHPMRRIVCVLFASVALAGVVAYVGTAFGQGDSEVAPIFGAGPFVRKPVFLDGADGCNHRLRQIV
jgi:hypothetical protein